MDRALADLGASKRINLAALKTAPERLDLLREQVLQAALTFKYAMWTAEREARGSA